MLDGCLHCSAIIRRSVMSSVHKVTTHDLEKMLTLASLMVLFYVLDIELKFIFNNNYYIIQTVHTIPFVEKKCKRSTILIMFTLIIA